MLKKALVIGASGLIGRNLVFELLKSNLYEKVIVIARKDLIIKHAKLELHLTEFDKLEDFKQFMAADDVFCCLGSTKAKTPDLNSYRKVDYEYPLHIAKLALEKGAKQFLLVTAMGADIKSALFYNKTKGEVEAAISAINYLSLQIFRPALLLGSRNEYRPIERVTQAIFRVLNPLLFGPFRSLKAIDGTVVAKAMLKAANQENKGIRIWLNPEIMDLVKE